MSTCFACKRCILCVLCRADQQHATVTSLQSGAAQLPDLVCFFTLKLTDHFGDQTADPPCDRRAAHRAVVLVCCVHSGSHVYLHLTWSL